jgi:hypothetical protein
MLRSLRTLAAAGVVVLVFAPPVMGQTVPPPLQPFPQESTTAPLGASADRVVEITRQVPFQDVTTAVFTVPPDTRLVVTDALISNLGTVAVCGVTIDRGTGSAVVTGQVLGAPQPSLESPLTVSDSTLTGPLCVQPRTTQQLILTTGVDFTAGQTIQVGNRPDAALPPGSQGSAVSVHLRGFLTPAVSTTQTQ